MIRRLLRKLRKTSTPGPVAPLPVVPRTTEELKRAQEYHRQVEIRVRALEYYRDNLAQKRKGSA